MLSKGSKYLFSGVVIALALILSACAGTLAAELPASAELEIEDGVEELEFSGEIQEMGADSWTVAGISFFINAGTEIEPGLELNNSVEVHARLNSDDELTAYEIKALEDGDSDEVDNVDDDEADHEDEDEFTGTIDSMGADSWVIGGTTVAITSDTEIKGDLALGDMVKVHASMVDGVLTAREIEPVKDDDVAGDDEDDPFDEDEHEEEFVGTVEAISDTSWTVSGRTFTITADSEIDGDIKVGDVVKVELKSDGAGNLVAYEIELADDDDVNSSDDSFEDEDDDADDHDDDEHEDDEHDGSSSEDDHHDEEDD